MTQSTFGALLHAFMVDDKLKVVLVLVLVDFVLGVAAAAKLHTFRLSYITNFLRDDVLAKVVPWFVLYAGAILAGGASVAGLDLGDAAGSVFALIVAAMVASILGSLRDMGINLPTPVT